MVYSIIGPPSSTIFKIQGKKSEIGVPPEVLEDNGLGVI
jgi:hypothetical protein